MSGGPDSRLQTVAFGDPDGHLWGAAVNWGAATLVVGDDAGHTAAEPLAAGGWSLDGAAWRLSGDGFDLRVEPVSPAPGSATGQSDAAAASVQDLCRVAGTVTIDGRQQPVECAGTRTAIEGLDDGGLASLRAVAGWFDAGEGFTLLALRAARSRGQESDRVAAALFEPEGRVAVSDPRLSTTYDGEGMPTRVTLEFWVGQGDEEFPRRAAGEASAPGSVTGGQVPVRAVPLRCHSRGREGAGVYVLAGR